MRVAILDPSGPGETGGVATYARGLSSALRSAGIDSELFVSLPRAGFPFKPDLAKSILPEPKLMERLRAFDPEVVHANGNWRLVALMVRGNWRRPPATVFTFHTRPSGRVMRFRRAGLVRLLKQVDLITATSNAGRAEVLSAFGGAFPVSVLHPGITPTADALSQRSRGLVFTRRDAAVRIVAVSKLAWRRKVAGLSLLVDAVAALHERGLAVQLDICGDGPLRPQVERHIQKTHTAAYVHLRGAVTNPNSYLSQADVFAHVSFQDTFSLATLEAMAIGLPVVCSAVGGIPELVEHESSGLLVENSLESVVAALKRVIDDPTLGDRMGVAARDSARQFYWTNRVQEHVRAYEMLLKR